MNASNPAAAVVRERRKRLVALWAAAAALPLAALALLRAAPHIDERWENNPAHFWLVLVAGLLSMALGYAVREAALRRRDARLFLIALAFITSAGFLALHALATPGVLVGGKNAGFVVAPPVGLLLAGCFAALSAVDFRPAAAAAILRGLGTPLLIHQPSYSLLNRWIEPELLDTLAEEGVGCIGFSPLAQGMLTDKYLHGIPDGSRASRGDSLSPDLLTDEALGKISALNEIAARRGQTLAQMALAWTLRDPRMTSTLVGASSVAQLEANVATLDRLDFTEEELAEIDRHATDSNINLWAASSSE